MSVLFPASIVAATPVIACWTSRCDVSTARASTGDKERPSRGVKRSENCCDCHCTGLTDMLGVEGVIGVPGVGDAQVRACGIRVLGDGLAPDNAGEGDAIPLLYVGPGEAALVR
mmetsp:Transcript_146240/g.272244  ORF Transcript_146240/g.272244 Transcript_146240/m.272244 type:complete len:114 (+) Transcript_146240:127-468(+)